MFWNIFAFLSGLTQSAAKSVICVAYNAIKISDVQRSQLQSSARILGLKDLGTKDKSYLIHIVANRLIEKGYIKIEWNSTSPKRDNIVKLKPF